MDSGADSYRRFLDGDDDGLVELIRDYKDGLMLFLNRYVNNIHLAEELTEDTFFRLVTKKPRFSARYSFKTWLYTIGRNLAVSSMRRNRRLADTPVEELMELKSDEAELERACLREERKITVHRALDKINPDYSRVLYLKYFEDLTNEEIAAVMKKSKRQIENILYQAKGALRSQLDKEGFVYEEL